VVEPAPFRMVGEAMMTACKIVEQEDTQNWESTFMVSIEIGTRSLW
jgi:hypothetical protein